MDRFWLREYPPGVPADIDPNVYPSLKALSEDAFARYNDRIAYLSMGTSLTYRQLDRKSAAFGAWLQSRGLVKGDRLAIMMPNLPQYPVVVAAALRAGLIIVNVNPLYTPRELDHQLADSDAKAIVVYENFAHVLQQSIEANASLAKQLSTIVVASTGDLLGTLKGGPANLSVAGQKSVWK